MKKTSISFLLAMLFLLGALTACGKKGSNSADHSTNETNSNFSGEQVLHLTENGRSDFVILADTTDFSARQFAYSVQESISRKTGVTLPVRGLSGKEQYQYCIAVGNTGLTISEALKESTPENGFSVKSDTQTLALYATNAEGYLQLETYVSDTLLAECNQTDCTVRADLSLSYEPDLNKVIRLFENQSSPYCLVYRSNDEASRKLANQTAVYLEKLCGVRLKVSADTQKTENEILLGNCDRKESKNTLRYLNSDETYAVRQSGNKLILAANGELGLVGAIATFAEIIQAQKEGSVLFSSAYNRFGKVDMTVQNEELKQISYVYKTLFGTYGSWAEMKFSSASQNDKNDQALVEALIARMGNSVALSVGSSSALYNGFKIKLDSSDHKKATKLVDSHIYAPAAFFKTYFGDEAISTDSEGYFDLTAYCAAVPGYTLSLFSSYGLAVVLPEEPTPFDNLRETVNGYQNGTYLSRMVTFFNNAVFPEPQNNIEQSRLIIAQSPFDSNYVFDYTKVAYDTYYSPAICAAEEADGSHTLYVAHEVNHLCNWITDSTKTVLRKSTDGGKSWITVGEVSMMQWASLFELNGDIWLLGYSHSKATAVIAVYHPKNNSFESKDLNLQVGGSAPCAVAIANGRLYKAFNNAVISIDLSQNLMNSDNWTISNDPNQLITKEWYMRVTGVTSISPGRDFRLEEGNVTVGPDGKLYVYYRIDAYPSYGYAAIFQLSDDGNTLSVIDSCNSILSIPSTESKFTVKYDEKTGLYISFFSYPTVGQCDQRNVLAMAVSEDLFHWEVVDIILVERELINNTLSYLSHAYQYVDFEMVGNDLYFVVREATGATNSYHDGAYVTLYKIENYAEWLREYRIK